MGADIVIAVDIGTPLLERDKMQTLLGVISQAISVMMIRSTRENLAAADLVLQPDLGSHTNMNFRAADEIARLGRLAAEQDEDLNDLSLDAGAFQRHMAERAARRREIEAPPRRLVVAGATEHGERLLRHKIEPHLNADRLATAFDLTADEPAPIEHALTGLVGSGRYARAGYTIRDESLEVQFDAKRNGPPFVRFGIDLGHDGSEAIDFALKARLIAMGIGTPGSEIRADVGIGTDQWIGAEYFARLTGRGLFVAPNARADRSKTDLYVDGTRVAAFNVSRAGFGLDLGVLLGRSGEIRLGGVWNEVDARVSVGEPTIAVIEGRERLVFLRWLVDRRDGPLVPTRGVRLATSLAWIFDAPEFEGEFGRFQAEAYYFRPISPGGSLYIGGSGGTTFSTERAPATQHFTIGGPFNVSSLRPDERRGSHAVTGALGYLHPIADLPVIIGRQLYVTGLFEGGSAFEGRLEDARFDISFGGGLVAETMFGGVMLGGAIGGEGQLRWFFRIGRLF